MMICLEHMIAFGAAMLLVFLTDKIKQIKKQKRL